MCKWALRSKSMQTVLSVQAWNPWRSWSNRTRGGNLTSQLRKRDSIHFVRMLAPTGCVSPHHGTCSIKHAAAYLQGYSGKFSPLQCVARSPIVSHRIYACGAYSNMFSLTSGHKWGDEENCWRIWMRFGQTLYHCCLCWAIETAVLQVSTWGITENFTATTRTPAERGIATTGGFI